MAAVDLYVGGFFPLVRPYLEPTRFDHVRIVSGLHGLLHPAAVIEPYDLRLDDERARRLRPQVTAALDDDFDRYGNPDEVMVLLDPTYLTLVSSLLPRGVPIYWYTDPDEDAAAVVGRLDEWGWVNAE